MEVRAQQGVLPDDLLPPALQIHPVWLDVLEEATTLPRGRVCTTLDRRRLRSPHRLGDLEALEVGAGYDSLAFLIAEIAPADTPGVLLRHGRTV